MQPDDDDRVDCPDCDGNGWVDDPSDGGTMCCPNPDCVDGKVPADTVGDD